MKTYPILFNGWSVRAILAGRKTQTRRVIKPQPWHLINECPPNQWCWTPKGRIDDIHEFMKVAHAVWWDKVKSPQSMIRFCPYGQPGDRLWVRESFWELTLPEKIGGAPQCKRGPALGNGTELHAWYDGTPDPRCGWLISERRRPSIHMPRWASRITLEITDVKVERVQDISLRDMWKEGIETDFDKYDHSFKEREKERQRVACEFIKLWNSINEKRSFGWSTNPWVFVIEFKQI